MSQSQFILNPLNKSKSKTIWPIPLLTDNKDFPEIFETKRLVVKSDLDYLKFNSGSRGLYRTIYDQNLNAVLAKKVQAGELLPLDRLSILSDIADAAKAGKISIVEAIKLLTAFKNEDDSAVWDIIAGTLGSLRHVMNDDQVREDIKPLVRGIVAKQVKRLGWKIPAKEPHFNGLLRPTVLGMAASADDPETVKTVFSMFESITEKNNPIDPDLRSLV
ncbi:MAG: ERAP1-like C-terminal domain-containing protein, partial [Alphaproteobacteria bacterium]